MNNRTVYLWKAHQSEPGCDDFIVDLTHDRDIPPPDPDRQHHPETGLVYQESLYDDWKLIGEVNCEEMLNNQAGDNFVDISGDPLYASDVYRLKRYRSIT